MRTKIRSHSVIYLFFILFFTTADAQWQRQNIQTSASFRGLSVVNQNVIWASGTGGTVIKTINGGKNWTILKVSDAENLDFRDIEAFNENTAYILSIGNGEASRIYRTNDGGKTWEMQYKADKENIFLDAFAFWDVNNGIAMGDPVDGYFFLLRTTDGGKNWYKIGTDKQFPAKDGEAAFAASGTCIITVGKKNALMVSGGKAARVFRSDSYGNAWLVSESPIISGVSSQGIFSIAMFNTLNGVIVGGDYQSPTKDFSNLAFTSDGGKSWKPTTGLSGYYSAVSYIDLKTIVAVGSNGSSLTRDAGKTWRKIDYENYNAVQSRGKNAVWAVGAKGIVAKYIIK